LTSRCDHGGVRADRKIDRRHEMRIDIDESGNFMLGDGSSRCCCVAALVTPDAVADELHSAFVALRLSWTDKQEVKGSSLSDEHMAAALRLLGTYDVLVVARAYDAGYQDAKALEIFRRGQGEAFINGLTPQHHPNAHRWGHQLRADWLALPTQLMAQMYTLLLTMYDVITHAPSYYAQRSPAELGRFAWAIDPKDVTPTRYEKLWQQIVKPVLQTMSMEDPMPRVEGFDYSAMEAFFYETPTYLQNLLPPTRRRGEAVDLNLILRDASFPDSKDAAGIQLVDIVASAITKTLNGKLPPPVWRLLGPLLLERPHREPVVLPIQLGPGKDTFATPYHQYVLKALTNRCKSMLLTC
jgi:hypothetical protein